MTKRWKMLSAKCRTFPTEVHKMPRRNPERPPTKTYHMFIPNGDRFYESVETAGSPKMMSYLMDILRNDKDGLLQGVVFLVANREFVIPDSVLKSIGLTRKELDDLAKELA